MFRRWLSRNWLWIGPGLGVLVSVVVFAGVILVGMRPTTQDSEADLIADWNRTISKLGIEPVFPPEEDIYVGDLFAVVTQDRLEGAGSPSRGGQKSTAADGLQSTAMLGRAIKLDHTNLTAILIEYYKNFPVFSDTTKRPAVERDVWEQSPQDEIFTNKSPRKLLALAAFPGFSIKHSRAASGDVSASWLGRLRTSLERNDSEELQIPFAETYGIPTMLASGLLESYCRDPFTREVCTDKNLRKHLAFVLGDKVREKMSPTSGEFRYVVQIELVNRVYLTRAINRRRSTANSNEAGLTPRTSPAKDPSPPAVQGVNAAAIPGASPLPSNEAKLPADTALVLGSSGKSQDGNDVSLDRTFQRPIVFGYRAVRFSFDEEGQGIVSSRAGQTSNKAAGK